MTALALRLRNSGQLPVLAAAGCTVVLLLVGSLYSSNFLSADYLLLQLQIAAFLGIIATGAMIVILLGGIDLSVPWGRHRRRHHVGRRGGLVGARPARRSRSHSASSAARCSVWPTASASPTCACPR